VGRTHSPWGLAERLDIPTDLNDLEYAKAGYQEYLKRYLRCVKEDQGQGNHAGCSKRDQCQ
jgi:hypothetical protein